jgi:hypothetical protein
MPDIQGMVRREVMQAMSDAAGADKLSLDTDAVAIASQPGLFVANVPVAGLEKVDFKSMLDGRSYLDNTPIMYWHLAGEALRDKAVPLDEGFYTVVADQQQGTVALRNAKGETVAEGDLGISIEPEAPTVAKAKTSISGKITSADVDFFPPRVKVCGEVTVKKDGVTVKVSGCVSAGF